MLGRNLKMIREIWGLSQAEFGYLMGASRGMIMQYENRGTTPKSVVFRNIVKETGFSKDVLVNTEIEPDDVNPMSMYSRIAIDNMDQDDDNIDTKETDELIKARPGKNFAKPVIEATPLRLVDPYGFEATGQKFYTLADGSDVMQIPIIPVKAYGSYLRGHADPEWFDAMNFDTMTIPVDKLHKGTYVAFEMDGDSMVNIETKEMARKSLWPGQKIIGRDVKREHWKHRLHMHNNEAWIIVHRERGIVVKDITEHDINTGRIKCHSWNPDKEEHPDYDIYLDDVEQLMNVVDPFGKLKPY